MVEPAFGREKSFSKDDFKPNRGIPINKEKVRIKDWKADIDEFKTKYDFLNSGVTAD
jgi:hypothetical protein